MVSTVSAIIILDHFDKFDSEGFLLQCEQTLLGLGSLSMEKAHALVAYFNCNIVFVLSLPPEMEDFADALFPKLGPAGAQLGPNYAQLGPNWGPYGMLLGLPHRQSVRSPLMVVLMVLDSGSSYSWKSSKTSFMSSFISSFSLRCPMSCHG